VSEWDWVFLVGGYLGSGLRVEIRPSAGVRKPTSFWLKRDFGCCVFLRPGWLVLGASHTQLQQLREREASLGFSGWARRGEARQRQGKARLGEERRLGEGEMKMERDEAVGCKIGSEVSRSNPLWVQGRAGQGRAGQGRAGQGRCSIIIPEGIQLRRTSWRHLGLAWPPLEKRGAMLPHAVACTILSR
jgi:hypothetical protein